jgi:hypothetical protein
MMRIMKLPSSFRGGEGLYRHSVDRFGPRVERFFSATRLISRMAEMTDKRGFSSLISARLGGLRDVTPEA